MRYSTFLIFLRSLYMLQFNCPDCGKLFETDDSYAGGQVICDKCGFHFYVPEMENINEVIVEYVDEKTSEKEALKKRFAAALNKYNFLIFTVFLLFLLSVGCFFFLRHKRLIAEKARREAILKLEQEIAKENQLELERTLVYIRDLYKRIRNTPYDRGQTFGTHIDRFVLNYTNAENLFRKKQYAECEKKMRSAKADAEWIIKNAPLRDNIKRQLQLIADAVKKSPVSEEKLKSVKTAYYYYTQGNFEDSMRYLEQYHNFTDAAQR